MTDSESRTYPKYIGKDTITDANVLRVHANSILIDVFGAQCILPVEEISYKILGFIKDFVKLHLNS